MQNERASAAANDLALGNRDERETAMTDKKIPTPEELRNGAVVNANLQGAEIKIGNPEVTL
jgi:hypothetical protein